MAEIELVPGLYMAELPGHGGLLTDLRYSGYSSQKQYSRGSPLKHRLATWMCQDCFDGRIL